MDFEKAITYLFLVVAAFSYLYATNHFDTDYHFHLAYHGDGPYPPFLSWLLSPFSDIATRGSVLFVLNLLFSVALPFILIAEITHSWDPAVVYLLSGVPLLLFIIWTVPQSVIMVFMLLAIYDPAFLLLFLVGPLVHEFWYAALALAIGYHVFTYYKARIELRLRTLRLPYGP